MPIQYLGHWSTGLIYIISGATVPCSNSVASRGATYPVGRNYMPMSGDALWPGSLTGSRRGKNMLLLYFSESGLANSTVKKHSSPSKKFAL